MITLILYFWYVSFFGFVRNDGEFEHLSNHLSDQFQIILSEKCSPGAGAIA